MKRTPLLNQYDSDDSVMLYHDVALSVVPDEGWENAGIPTGTKGGVCITVSLERVLIRYVGPGLSVRKCGVKRTSPRQILVETLKGIAKLLSLPNWRDVNNASLIDGWIKRRINEADVELLS